MNEFEGTDETIVVNRREWEDNQARLARVEATLAQLAGPPVASAEEAPVEAAPELHGEDPATEPAAATGLTRRRLLLGGAGVAAGAAVIGGTASPAAAGNGSTFTIGVANNAASLPTGLQASGGAYGLGATDGNYGGSIPDQPTVVGQAGGSAWATGVLGTYTGSGSGAGVRGRATVANPGVEGISDGGDGVRGTSNVSDPTAALSKGGVHGIGTVAAGVRGESTSGPGVAGTGQTGVSGSSSSAGGVAVAAAATGTAVGVYSTAVSNAAFNGTSTNGTGLNVTATNGTAILAQAPNGIVADFRSDHRHMILRPVSGTRPAPTSDAFAHSAGELLVDGSGILWYCTAPGTPGTWEQISGKTTAEPKGLFKALPTPVRVYDSRTGTPQGPKGKLATNVPRTFDLTVNSSGVPTDATAVMVSLLLVNCAAGNGNFTIWANGAARPTANNMVWGGTAARYSSLAVTAVDNAGKCQVVSALATDFVLDVAGYFT